MSRFRARPASSWRPRRVISATTVVRARRDAGRRARYAARRPVADVAVTAVRARSGRVRRASAARAIARALERQRRRAADASTCAHCATIRRRWTHRPTAAAAAAPQQPVSASGCPSHRRPTPRRASSRALKTMLFADFAGYSRLHDAFAPLFQRRFWKIVRRRSSKHSAIKPLKRRHGATRYTRCSTRPTPAPNSRCAFSTRCSTSTGPPPGLSTPARSGSRCMPAPCSAASIRSWAATIISARASPRRANRAGDSARNGLCKRGVRGNARRDADSDDFALEYIGKLALAKGYGESRIYRLRSAMTSTEQSREGLRDDLASSYQSEPRYSARA